MPNLALAFFLFRATLCMPEPYPYIIYVDASKETRTHDYFYNQNARGFVTEYTFILTNEPERAKKYSNKFIAEGIMHIVQDRYKERGWTVWVSPYSLDPKEFMPNYKDGPIYELQSTDIRKLEVE